MQTWQSAAAALISSQFFNIMSCIHSQ